MTALPLSVPRVAPTRGRAILLMGSVFMFFFAAYAFTASADFFSTGDTTIRIEVAENISGRFSANLYGWKLQYPHHMKKEYLDPRVSTGRGGHTVSTYLLGQPLAIIPFDILGSRLAVHERWPYGPAIFVADRLVGPLFGALEVALFFLFCVRLGYGRFRSLILAGILGFASVVWPDEQSVLEHGEVAFFLLLGIYFVFRFRDQRGSRWYIVAAGAGIGGILMTRYQDAFLGGLAAGLYLVLPDSRRWRENLRRDLVDRLQRCLLFFVGLLPAICVDLWYNWFRYGRLFESGHKETVFGYAIWKGTAGLAISPGKGLLWYCPVLFLLVLAFPPFARRLPQLSIAIGAATAGFFLLYGYVTYWHGDPTWGPRYVFPTVPLLLLPLGTLFQWQGSRRRLVLAITAAVVAVSFLIQLSAVSVSPWRTWYRVISYEENQGSTWQWIAARYRYHWNIHESPLNFQLHGLYQLAYDDILNSKKYEIVPPVEDPILDNMTVTYAINQWNLWWASNEFNWWMGRDKIIEISVLLVALMIASGTYAVAETTDAFVPAVPLARPAPLAEAV